MKVYLGILWMYFLMVVGYPVMGLLIWCGYQAYEAMMWYDRTHQVVGSKEGQAMVMIYFLVMVFCWFWAACTAHETTSYWGIIFSGRGKQKNNHNVQHHNVAHRN